MDADTLWKSICITPQWISETLSCVSLNRRALIFFFFFTSSPESFHECFFPASLLSKRFFVHFNLLWVTILGTEAPWENIRLLWFFNPSVFPDWWAVLFCFVTVLPVLASSCSQRTLKDTLACCCSYRQSPCSTHILWFVLWWTKQLQSDGRAVFSTIEMYFSALKRCKSHKRGSFRDCWRVYVGCQRVVCFNLIIYY